MSRMDVGPKLQYRVSAVRRRTCAALLMTAVLPLLSSPRPPLLFVQSLKEAIQDNKMQNPEGLYPL